MILNWIKLVNIRSFVDAQIKFPTGSILLSGDIGSGKSTILSAFEFGLFGAMRGVLLSNALLRKGTSRGSVEICFSIDNKNIVIKRNLKAQNSSVIQEPGYVIINGLKTEGTSTELRAIVLDLLGYPKEMLTKSKGMIFRYTIYTPQDQMKQIILEDKELRLNTLRSVFGIDKYKRISENAKSYTKKLKDRKKELGGIIYDLDDKKSKLNKFKEDFEARSIEESKIFPLLISVKESLIKKRAELKLFEEKLASYNEINKKIEVITNILAEKSTQKNKQFENIEKLQQASAVLKESVDQLNKNIFSDDSFEVIDEKLSKKEIELGNLEETERKTIREGTLCRERKIQIEKRMEELTENKSKNSEKLTVIKEKQNLYKELVEQIKDKELINIKLDEINKEIEKINSQLSSNSTIIEQSEKLKQKIEGIDVCPTCEQVVSQTHKHSIISREDEKIYSLKKRLAEFETQKSEFTKSIDREKEYLEKIREIEKKIAVLGSEVKQSEELEYELEKLEKAKLDLQKERSDLIEKIEQFDLTKLDEVREKIGVFKEELKGFQKLKLSIQEKSNLEKNLADKNQQIEDIKSLLAEADIMIKNLNLKKEDMNERLKSFENIIENHNLLKQELDKLLDEEKQVELKKQGIEQEMETCQRFIDELTKEVIVKEEAKHNRNKVEKDVQWFDDFFISLMGVMEKHVLMKVYHEFKDLFTKWFDALIEDETITVSLNDEFTPVVIQNGYEVEVENLSGGEKTSVALAYRLALNKVINDVVSDIKTKSIIVLDEPTDGFSNEQLDRVREVLDQLDVEQIILVSHETKIEGFVDQVIRIQKNDHVSEVIVS